MLRKALFGWKAWVAAATLSLTVASMAAADSSIDGAPVERGKYVAAAGNCLPCHTNDGGQQFAGGRAFHTPFGTVYSTNITPDPDTGIGKWSEEEFAAALRTGVRPNGEHLYPVFPYTAYTKMTNADVAALFQFLRSLQPVSATARENQLRFPYNQRWALGFWKTAFMDGERFEADAGKSAEWNRGKYLVDALGHCSACHSPRNFLGAEKSDRAMTGGEYIDKVPNGEMRAWAAPNLTAATNGLASWPVQELAAYLMTGRNGFTESFGPMNEVIADSTRHLTASDVIAMATYLKSLPANEGSLDEASSKEVQQEGSVLYDLHCGTCHLPSGMGDIREDAGARLAGSPVVQASNPASLINVILHGPQLPNPPLLPKRWKKMPAFAEKLSDEEIAALASFLRSAWGNIGGAVTSEDVAKQR